MSMEAENAKRSRRSAEEKSILPNRECKGVVLKDDSRSWWDLEKFSRTGLVPSYWLSLVVEGRENRVDICGKTEPRRRGCNSPEKG